MILKTALAAGIFLFITGKLYTQNNAEDYSLPKNIEGSNLYISSYPSLSSYKENNDSAESITRYSIDLYSQYSKWRFTPQFAYLVGLNAGASLSNEQLLFNTYRNSLSQGQLKTCGQVSRFLLKLAVIFTWVRLNFSPGLTLAVYLHHQKETNPAAGLSFILT